MAHILQNNNARFPWEPLPRIGSPVFQNPPYWPNVLPVVHPQPCVPTPFFPNRRPCPPIDLADWQPKPTPEEIERDRLRALETAVRRAQQAAAEAEGIRQRLRQMGVPECELYGPTAHHPSTPPRRTSTPKHDPTLDTIISIAKSRRQQPA